MSIRRLRAALVALSLFTVFAVRAEEPASAADAEMAAASEAARAAQQEGPRQVALGGQARLALPAGFAYIPSAQAARLMHAMGNQTDEGFMGVVVGETMKGFMTIRFEKSGYVKDDDARDWDADELLQNLKEGTEAGNEERSRRGIPEFVVAGWVQPPAYEPETHRLVWSAEVRDKVPSQEPSEPGVNYNTYQLGREGYISMNLVTDLANVESQKPIAKQLLDQLQFDEGKRYADFNSETDNVAKYGLAALVGGVAAKKLGLLATLGIFLAKFWKIAALAVVGFGAAARKWFGRQA